MTSEPIFLIASLTIATFISGSIDNLLLLIGYMSHYGAYKKEVFLGYLLDILIVTVVAVIFSYFTELFPTGILKYLGIIPISIGIYQLLQIFSSSSEPETITQLNISHSKVKIILTVCGIMLANSGDTLAVFVALMADTQKGLRWIAIVIALLMGLVWGVIARIFLSNHRLKSMVKPISKYVLPLILILIGWYILADSPTDTEGLVKTLNPSI